MTTSQPDIHAQALNAAEARLAAIWAEVLGVAPAGPDEDLFSVGGDSIAAAALLARVGAEVSIGEFLREPTIGALARLIEHAEPRVPARTGADVEGVAARCSYAQERFYFIDQATGLSVVSNVCWAVRLRGPLDVHALESALASLASRHESLRTHYELAGDVPVQVVEDGVSVPLRVRDAADETAATEIAAAEAQVPFDLGRAPLLRAQLLALGPGDHVLQFVAHHILCDDWSKGVIMSELGALYAAQVEGVTAQLSEPSIQYPAYGRWQRERLTDEVLAHELEHWQRRLAGAPPALELPIDHPRPAAPTLRGARLRTSVSDDLAAALRSLGREHGTTLFMTVLAAFEAFLHRYTRQDDLVLGTAIDNRGRVELERGIGLFTNVLALRADLSGNPTFRELLMRSRADTVDAIAHGELPFDRLAAAAPDRDATRHPVFQVFYEFIVPAPLELPLPGVSCEAFEVPKRTSEFDLGLYMDAQRGGLDAVWEYSTDLFEESTVERMARHFIALLRGLVAEPDRPIAELPLLDDAEQHRALIDWNATDTEIPEACVHTLFERHAARTPGATALVAGDVECGYSELNQSANRIAHLLRNHGVGVGDTVGLLLERSVDVIAAILGILKAGAAFVPLNPDHPAARLITQLETAGARTLIAQEPLADFDGELIVPDPARLVQLPASNLPPAGSLDDLAYVLFTSGSTGVPKGVAVTHRNLVNYAVHMIGALGAEGLHFGSVSAVSTDLGNTAIFPALAGGGCLHLIASEVATDAEQFASYVARRPLDLLKITPSHMSTLLDAAAGAAVLPRHWLILGGEALSWELADRVRLPGGPRVMNHYGPTEATVGCCTFELADAGRLPSSTVPIGYPISNARVYLLDSQLVPVPVGVPGEIYIGGAGVAAGYVGQPELTAQAFLDGPFVPGGRLYRTGDLARYLGDGSIEFLGRADQQVKIRGYRVEPAEVQAVLMRDPGVRQAAVTAVGEGEGMRLIGYVVTSAPGLSVDGLRAALERTLPGYMVPAQIFLLDALPLTPNGKLDRRALPGEDEAPEHTPTGAASEEPLDEVEAALAAIFSELLEHDVGVDENFFDSGGHSLLAIRLIARVRADLGAKLSIKALIDAPTIAELATKIRAVQKPPAPAPTPADKAPPSAQAAPAGPEQPVVPRAPRGGPLRSSFAQEQFWLVDALASGSGAYNFSWPMRITGALNVDALSRAVVEVIRRHEALRTAFAALDGQPMQIVSNAGAGLELVDLADDPDPEAAATKFIDEQTQAAFDLARGPLLRVWLLRLGAGAHVLQIVVHHIVFDGVSKVVLYRELAALYEAFGAGRDSPLTDPEIQYGDFAEWQRAELDEVRVGRELAHWRGELQGMTTVLELPTDRPRPPVATLRGARHRRPVPSELREALQAVARTEGATFFMAVLAAFDVLLYRYSGQEDIVVGTPVDTRSRPELERVVGPFINTVVVRSDLSGSPSFRELLRRVKGRLLDAIDHQELPFERLVEALAPERDLSRHPLFQALLALNPPEQGLPLPGVEVEDIEPAWSAARVDLFLVLDDLPQGLEAIWEYSTDLFDAATIERMAGHFVRLLEAIVASPETPIDALELLDPGERATLLEGWTRTEAEIPEGRVEALIAAQAKAAPDHIAVEFEDRTLTYGELEARANQLAHRLQALGAGVGELVGVCLPRSEELLVALLATMKSGAAYVPIDPGFPAARQRFMLADAQVRVLLTTEELLGWLPVDRVAVLCLDRDRAAIAAEPSDAPAHDGDTSGLAYVIYTSGSTGTPKGVEIEHRALVNFLASMRSQPGLASDDVLLAVTTLSFDIAGLELYLPLTAGARVVIASAQTASDPRALARLLASSSASVMQATPTTWRMLVDSDWSGAGLKALCGGEALPRVLADDLLACGVELWNMYGPTETTIWSTIERVRSGAALSIGRPIANTTLYVLDRRGEPTPIGVPGELHIGGAGLARGYRGRDELTAERFITSDAAGGRVYKTGDLARYRADGTVQFLGRLDHQVKLRGFRIELGEIEAVLGSHPSVAAAAATVYSAGQQEPALVAYVVLDGDRVDVEELQRFLGQSLPAYMIPSSIIVLERLPLTPNGKLDRTALPAPEARRGKGEYVAPRTPTEELIAGVWSDVLQVPRIGAHDDFFELGGQSLLAARLMSRLCAKLELELPLRTLFEAPTVALFAAHVAQARAGVQGEGTRDVPALPRSGPAPEPPPLVPAARTRPASYAQERFWFIDQLGSASAAYNISWPVRLRGSLDVVALERALGEIVRRHEILRTRFEDDDGRPMQVIEPPRPPGLKFNDLRGAIVSDEELQRLVDEETQTPFDLVRGPLLRLALIRVADDDHVLQVVVHHIAADGWSKNVFFSELGSLYAAFADNRPAGLPELPVQYGDFAEWERSWIEGARLERELAWWREQLDGIPTALELPSDRPRPAVATLTGGWRRTTIPAPTLETLTELASREGVTLFMVMLAAFEVVLHRYSGQDTVVIGTPVSTRGRPELEHLIGPFVNTVAVRGDLSGVPSFRELLHRVRARVLDAVEHQELPFERLVEAIAPDRDLSRHPLFQALLSLTSAEPGIELPGLSAEELETSKTTSRVDLTLLLQEQEHGFDAVWEYSSDLFDVESIDQLARHFLCLLQSIAAAPQTPIDELAIVDPDERVELLGAFAGESASFEVACLHESFEAQTERTPDAVALSFGAQSLSYRELNARANRLAHHLRSLDVGPDTLVALCLERSLEQVIAILAVLKAGGAYVPLDPEYPAERLSFVLEDSKAQVVITMEDLLGRLGEHACTVVCLDRDENAVLQQRDASPPPLATPENLAYVIYTSGSTGRPKGVLVEHRNVARLFTATDAWFAFGSDDVWTLLHSYAFDFSVWEIWGALLYGGRVVVVPPWTARAPEALAKLLIDERVSVLNSTPSLFLTAMDELLAVADGLALRYVVFGGEALQTRLLRPWFERFRDGGPQLVNMYGITETTVHVTYRAVTAADAERDGSPIGVPIPDLQLYVLDGSLAPVPVGVAGELFVGGAGVTRGYLNRPELTAERFIENPFGSGRLYRTGDGARRVRHHGLMFEGRIDDQIKIRGFRIELGEIQAALSEHVGVADCAVVASTVAPGDTRLAAYVVPAMPTAPTAAQLRSWLASKLPDYMVPSAFTTLEALPLTTNGKLDRRALPAPVDERPSDGWTAPRTALERDLAALWQELLGVERVGVHDDFFALGGHSLLAAQLVARVRAEIRADFSVRAVFDAPTVAGLAGTLEASRVPGTAAAAPVAITRRPAGAPFPLSYSQQQLWLLDQWDPGAPTYNVSLPFRIRGALDRAALRTALNRVLARHEALRTVISVEDDQPVPVLLDNATIELVPIDLGGRLASPSEEELIRVMSELAVRPFDFARDPLLRASLLRLGSEDHVLLLETHHIGFDGISEQVLLEELSELYQGRSLAEPELQFGDFALWQRAWLAGEELAHELDWWRRHLAGAPTSIDLPVDHPRPAGRRFRGASHDIVLDRQTAQAAGEVCRTENVTPYMLVLAALGTLLFRITGEHDVLVGSPAANRQRVELERLIGFCSNTLVFRARMGGNPMFRELLGRVREMALGVYAHQGLPFEKIVEAVAPAREAGVNPLFQVNLRVSGANRPTLELPGLEIAPIKVDSGFARFDLALDLNVLPDRIAGYFRYNRDMFEPDTMARLAEQFASLLGAALADPDRHLLSFDVASDWSGSRPRASALRDVRRRPAPATPSS